MDATVSGKPVFSPIERHGIIVIEFISIYHKHLFQTPRVSKVQFLVAKMLKHHLTCNRGFTRQPCCMAGTIKMFCIRKNICSHWEKNLLFLPCNMAAVQNLCFTYFDCIARFVYAKYVWRCLKNCTSNFFHKKHSITFFLHSYRNGAWFLYFS